MQAHWRGRYRGRSRQAGEGDASGLHLLDVSLGALPGSEDLALGPGLQRTTVADRLKDIAYDIAADSEGSPMAHGHSPRHSLPPAQYSTGGAVDSQVPRSPAVQLTAASQSMAPRLAYTAAPVSAAHTAGLGPRQAIAAGGLAVDSDLMQAFNNDPGRSHVKSPRSAARSNRGRGGTQALRTMDTSPAFGAAATTAAATPGPPRKNPLAALLGTSGRVPKTRGRAATPRSGRGEGSLRPERHHSRFKQPVDGAVTPGHIGHGLAGHIPLQAPTPGFGAPLETDGDAQFEAGGLPIADAIVSSDEEGEAGGGAHGGGPAEANGSVLQHADPHSRGFETPHAPFPGPTAAVLAPSPAVHGSPAGDGTGTTRQRDFLATVAPPSGRSAPRTGRARGGVAVGSLEARLQTVAAQEQAVAEASFQQRRGGVRMRILQKEVQATVPKCVCVCLETDGSSAEVVRDQQVTAIFAAAAARGVDLVPGVEVHVYPPWRVVRVNGADGTGGSTLLMMCSGKVV